MDVERAVLPQEYIFQQVDLAYNNSIYVQIALIWNFSVQLIL